MAEHRHKLGGQHRHAQDPQQAPTAAVTRLGHRASPVASSSRPGTRTGTVTVSTAPVGGASRRYRTSSHASTGEPETDASAEGASAEMVEAGAGARHVSPWASSGLRRSGSDPRSPRRRTSTSYAGDGPVLSGELTELALDN